MQREAEERLAKAKRDVPRQSFGEPALKRHRDADDQDNELEVPPWFYCSCLLPAATKAPPAPTNFHGRVLCRSFVVAGPVAHAFCGAQGIPAASGMLQQQMLYTWARKGQGQLTVWYGKLISLCCYTTDYLAAQGPDCLPISLRFVLDACR